jgi:hypothetical protein
MAGLPRRFLLLRRDRRGYSRLMSNANDEYPGYGYLDLFDIFDESGERLL